MKKIIFALLLCATVTGGQASPLLQTGDLVFQSERGDFARAIQLATHSPYNHVGMIFIKSGKTLVFEAMGPVQFTPLEEWVRRGKGGRYAVKRLKNADKILTPEVLQKMDLLTRKFTGKAYDWTFGLSDKKIYCSELVWKMYRQSTGLELGHFQKLKELNLSPPLVQQQMREKFGPYIPLGLKIISPGQVFNSDLLKTLPQD